MGNVTPFPVQRTASRPAPPPAAEPRPPVARPLSGSTGGRGGQYGLGDVIRMLGLGAKTLRSSISTLRVLAAREGMPLPITPRVVGGEVVTGPRAIHHHSRWDAGRFDWWLERRTLPEGAAPAPVPQPVRDTMARRAASIGQGRS